MVSEETFEGTKSFKCDVCGFHYEDGDTAEKCENFCENNKSCSPEIIKHSIERRNEK